MVFSIYPPAFSELAKLRLRVFYIEDNQLQKKSLVRSNDEEIKKDKVNADSGSDFDSQISDFDDVLYNIDCKSFYEINYAND